MSDNPTPPTDAAPSTKQVQGFPEKEIIALREEIAKLQLKSEQAENDRKSILGNLDKMRERVTASPTLPTQPRNTFLEILSEIENFLFNKPSQPPTPPTT